MGVCLSVCQLINSQNCYLWTSGPKRKSGVIRSADTSGEVTPSSTLGALTSRHVCVRWPLMTRWVNCHCFASPPHQSVCEIWLLPATWVVVHLRRLYISVPVTAAPCKASVIGVDIVVCVLSLSLIGSNWWLVLSLPLPFWCDDVAVRCAV